jgi:epoxyqueuosine reductase QueG
MLPLSKLNKRRSMNPTELSDFITEIIKKETAGSATVTQYREPIVGFVAANAPGFSNLRQTVSPAHLMPDDLLPGARSVVSFFLPFAPEIAIANEKDRHQVAEEWAVAYDETNQLIGWITRKLIAQLNEHGVRAAAEPATGNFDHESLVSWWSHKSIAVLAGIGSFGLHHLVITDAGCAGRFGSVVLDTDLPINKPKLKERCEFYVDETCMECVFNCPVNALDEDGSIDKQACWARCQENDAQFPQFEAAQVCGKCSVGPCALESAV